MRKNIWAVALLSAVHVILSVFLPILAFVWDLGLTFDGTGRSKVILDAVSGIGMILWFPLGTFAMNHHRLIHGALNIWPFLLLNSVCWGSLLWCLWRLWRHHF